MALAGVAFARINSGMTEAALVANEEALVLTDEIANATARRRARLRLDVVQARIRKEEARLSEAGAILRGVVADSTELGNNVLASHARFVLAEIEFASGAARSALDLAEAGALMFRRHRVLPSLANVLADPAAYALECGEEVRARDAVVEALRSASRIGFTPVVMFALQHAASIGAKTAALRAARLSGYVDAWYQTLGFTREVTERRMYERLHATLRQSLSDVAVDRLVAEGARLSEQSALDEGLALAGNAASATA